MQLKRLLPVFGIIILFIILTQVEFNEIYRIFTGLNLLYVVLSFFVLIPLLILATIEWQLLLKRQRIQVSYWYSIKNFFIGYFYGFITPGGLGAYTRALYLQEESSAPLPKCFSNIIIFNTVEFFSMFIPGAVGAIILSSIYPYLFGIILLILTIIILLFLFFFKTEYSRSIFKKIVRLRIFSGLRDRLEPSIDTFHEDIPGFKYVLFPFALSVTGWMLKYTLLFFVAKMFQINIPFIYFISIMAVVDVIASIPISSYGLGIRDGSLLYLLTQFVFIDGRMISINQLETIPPASIITTEQVISYSLFLYLIIWLTPSLIGAIITIYETHQLHTTKKMNEQY